MTVAPATTTTAPSTPSIAGTNKAAGARPFNFSAGPAALPDEVLREAQEALWSVSESGVGILEHSHRGPVFDAVLEEAIESCRRVGNIPESHEVLFVPGGATLQFGMIPLNLLPAGGVADYLDTGVWAHKATLDAQRVAASHGASVHVAYDGRPTRYDHVPAASEIVSSAHPTYTHYTSNNTVYGTQFRTPPRVAGPLVCDASSDIFSAPFDFGRHALVYASGQKNLGPSGMVVVVVDRAVLDGARTGLPSMLDYRSFVSGRSRPNTPNTFAIYLVGRVCQWILRQGGVQEMARRAAERSAILYEAIDRSGGFYQGLVRTDSRSLMNVTFRLPTPELDAAFAAEADKAGLAGLLGHREVGGIRASIYNAMPLAGAKALAEFMAEFARMRG